VGQDLGHLGVGHEAIRDGGRGLGLHQDVQIPHRLPASAEAAGDLGPEHTGCLPQIAEQGLAVLRRDGAGKPAFVARRGAGEELVENALFRLGAKPGYVPDPPGPSGLLELLERGDTQDVMERLGALRAETPEPHDLDQTRWHIAAGGVKRAERAGLRDLDDLPGQVLADPRELHQSRRSLRRQRVDRLGQLLDRARGVPVRAHPERVGSLDLQEVA
jgi:hypothetical protein